MQPDIEPTDLPPVVFVERRHIRDRRQLWRGGRRNTDWINRPLGAWRGFERQLSRWHTWVERLPWRSA